jgi:hypothetical protein
MADGKEDQLGAVDPADLDPWERQPKETDHQWYCFIAYRDLELPRSLRKAAGKLGKSTRAIESYSSRFEWSSRVSAYDRHLDGIRRRENAEKNKQLEKVQGQHLSQARSALSEPVIAFLTKLRKMRKENEDDPEYNPFEQFTLSQLQSIAIESIRYMPTIIQAERLVAGLSVDSTGRLPGGVSAGDGTHDEARRRAEAMTRDELERMLVGGDRDDGRSTQMDLVGVDPANPG